jgi:hypothetical protein
VTPAVNIDLIVVLRLTKRRGYWNEAQHFNSTEEADLTPYSKKLMKTIAADAASHKSVVQLCYFLSDALHRLLHRRWTQRRHGNRQRSIRS